MQSDALATQKASRTPSVTTRLEAPTRGSKILVGRGFSHEHEARRISAASAAEVPSCSLPTDAGSSYCKVSSPSAISSNFLTVFQFLPVQEVFSVLSTSAIDSFGRPIPLGK